MPYLTLKPINEGHTHSMEWKTDQIFQFLKLYQKEPSLWDTSSIEHKNRDDTYDAWNRIQHQLGEGDVPIKEIKRKRDNLMSTYRRLRGKVEKSKLNNEQEVYKPDWPFYNFLAAFLDGLYIPRNLDTKQELEETSTYVSEDSNESNVEERDLTSPTSEKRKKISRKELKRQKNDATRYLKEINQKLDQDECALYTKLLCKRLRSLKESTRERAMMEIDRYVYNLKQQDKSGVETLAGLPQFVTQYENPETVSLLYSTDYKSELNIKSSPRDIPSPQPSEGNNSQIMENI